MELNSILYIAYSNTSITITIILALLFWMRRRAPGAKYMALMMGSGAIWAIGDFLSDLSSINYMKIFWDNVSYFGVVTLPVAWIIFTIQYTRYEGYLKRRKMFLLFIIPFITVLMVWTNNYHHLMMSSIEFLKEGQMTVLSTTFGMWFWVHAAYSYLMFLFGIILLVKRLVTLPQILRRQSVIILIAILVPLFLSILYTFKVDAVYPIDFTIFSFTFAGILCFFGMFRYRLFDLIPAARDAVMENMSGIVIVLDNQNHIMDINTAAKNILGIEEKDVIGKYAYESLGEWSSYFKRYENVRETGEKIWIDMKTGRKYFDLKITPLYDSRNKAMGKFVLLYNITALEEAIIDLRESRKAAEDANKAKSQFLATMSHEIRTPLNGIIGMTELLTSANFSEEEKGYLQTLQTCADSLLDIINDILDFSKIESGKMELENTDFNFRNMVDAAVKPFLHYSKEKDISFECKIDDTIPENLIGDPVRVKQILVNLVGNAFKFTDKGRVHLAVEQLKCEKEQAALRFTVSDTGIGIPEEKIDRLFKSFQQVDSSTTRRFGGTGLGLAIVKNLITFMGGCIDVESIPGEGSKFTFIISFKISNSKASSDTPGNEANFHNKDISILLVEDNTVNQTLIIKLLERKEIKVDVTGNGRAALRILEEKVYDLILMDIQMPEMDGYETTQEIRNKEAITGMHTPIIALTANATEQDRNLCLKAGMDDFLTKPLRSRKLYECIYRNIDRLQETDESGGLPVS